MRRSSIAAACFTIMLVMAFAPAAQAAPGDLDTSFDTDGVAVADFGAGTAEATLSVAIQADGRIVVGGWVISSSQDYGVARFDTGGTLDTTFGSGGINRTDFNGGADQASDMALTSAGKIVIAGVRSDPTSFKQTFALARYKRNGRTDRTFDGDGKVKTAFGASNAGADAVAVQPDNRIVAGGFVSKPSSTLDDFALARYNVNGSLDTTFDGDGKVTTDFALEAEHIFDLAIQSDGKIVAVGNVFESGATHIALARYNTDGTLDTSFSTDGKVSTTLGASTYSVGYGVALQADGGIVVVGEDQPTAGQSEQVVLRYEADGDLDPTFSGDGWLDVDFGGADVAYGVAIQTDGNIVMVGTTDVSGNFDDTVVRVDTAGVLDPSFGTGGVVVTDLGSGESAFGVALQTDGKIVLASDGAGLGPTAMAAIRYLAA